MATGASTADLAVILIDARKGVLTQTRRHAIIASLLGIRHVVLAVNKIDLVGFDQAVFDAHRRRLSRLRRRARLRLDHADPDVGPLRRQCHRPLRQHGLVLAARPCSSIWKRSTSTSDRAERSRSAFRCSGSTGRTSTSAALPARSPRARSRPGDEVVVASPARPRASSASSRMDGDLARAVAGEAVTLMLDDEVDVSRGDMLVSPDARPEVADQFAAHIVWFDEQRCCPAAPTSCAPRPTSAGATVTDLKHRIDVNTLRARGGQDARAERDRRLQHLDAGADRLRPLRATTARPAPSS